MTHTELRTRLDALGISRPGTSTRQAALNWTEIVHGLGDPRPPLTIQRQCEAWLHGDTASVPGWLHAMLTLLERQSTRTPPPTEFAFADLIEIDAIRQENHCLGTVCAYEHGCTCWSEFRTIR